MKRYGGGSLCLALPEIFPWARHLDEFEMRAFTRELAEVLSGAAELGAGEAVHRTLVSWRATARINADPDRLKEALRPLGGDVLGPVGLCGRRPPEDPAKGLLMKLDASLCSKTPEDIRRALEARPEWLHDFSADFMRAAAEFDSAEIAAALDTWHSRAVACLTPGYLEEIDALVARINAGDTDGLVSYDDEGRAWDFDNNRLPAHDKSMPPDPAAEPPAR